MTRALLVFLAAVTLAACGHTPREPEIRIKEVFVTVREPCIPEDVPRQPAEYADDALPKEPDAADVRYLGIAAANEQRRGLIEAWAPAIEACRRGQSDPPR